MQIQFHPTWERQLSKSDLDMWKQTYETSTSKTNERFSPILPVRKKDGGIAVHTFIQNASDHILRIEAPKMNYETNNTLIATAQFPYTLEIPANSVMPWTFVFSKTMLRNDEHLHGQLHWTNC